MKKLSLAVLTTAAIVLAGSAFADPAAAPAPTPAATPAPTATPAATTTAEATPDPNEIICQTEPPPTGSLIGGRSDCRPRRQWDERDKNSSIGQDLHRETMGSGVMQ
jgi:hypothetical protein